MITRQMPTKASNEYNRVYIEKCFPDKRPAIYYPKNLNMIFSQMFNGNSKKQSVFIFLAENLKAGL